MMKRKTLLLFVWAISCLIIHSYPIESYANDFQENIAFGKFLNGGQLYARARSRLLSLGWVPSRRQGSCDFNPGCIYPEASCSSSGMGYCRMEFKGENRTLVVIASGEPLTIDKWWFL